MKYIFDFKHLFFNYLLDFYIYRIVVEEKQKQKNIYYIYYNSFL